MVTWRIIIRFWVEERLDERLDQHMIDQELNTEYHHPDYFE